VHRLATERPLWLRWVLSVAAFSLLAAVIVLVIHQINHSGGATSDIQAAEQANQAGEALIAHDQAAHAAVLSRRARPTPALVAAISSDLRRQVSAHELAGPAGTVTCRLHGGRRAGRQPYRCVGSGGAVAYQLFGVVDLRTRRMVWCRQDQVDPGLAVPLDPACLR
jgi:hypothetical protein